jgi:hypothetical protein
MKLKMQSMALMLVASLGLSAQSGDRFFEEEDFYNAARYYEQEVKDNPEAYKALAESYLSLGQPAKAKGAYQLYLERYPKADRTLIEDLIGILERDYQSVDMRSVAAANTQANEYSPLVSKDGKTLYFTGDDREGGLKGEDIFSVKRQADGSWGKAQAFNAFNTRSHEGLKAINESNDVVILFGNYPGSFGSGDLFYSLNEKRTWSAPCNLGGAINSKERDAMANLSANGRYLLYISDVAGGQGAGDIYFSEITEKGWSDPLNLGSVINKADYEATPFLAADNRTLYFASEGHSGFGGYDLFMSKRLDDSWTNWSEPVNLGPYINTIFNDYYLTIPAQGTRGYLPRKGDLATGRSQDIYEFILPPALRPETYINLYGRVVDGDSAAAPVLLRFYDQATGEEVAKTASDADSGY